MTTPQSRAAETEAKTQAKITQLTAERDALQAQLAATVRVPLTDEQIDDIWAGCSDPIRDEIDMQEFARAIEAAHNIGAKP